MTKALSPFSIILPLILSMSLFFVFGWQHLSQFVTADERYWVYERIPQYWNAMLNGQWRKTLINDKPGVSLALITGPGFFAHPQAKAEHVIAAADDTAAFETSLTQEIYRSFRLPILAFNALFLWVLFRILGKTTGNAWVALWATSGIALSPVLIGISQIVNPDALLWSFFAAALFAFLALLFRPSRTLSTVSGITLGLAILSKYTAVILYPFFFLLIPAYQMFPRGASADDDTDASACVKRHLRQYLTVCALSLVTIVALLPEMLLKPRYFAQFLTGFSSSLSFAYVGIAALLFCAALLLSFHHRLATLFLHRLKRAGIRAYPLLSRTLFAATFGFFIIILIGERFFPDWGLFRDVPFDIKETRYLDRLPYIPNFWETVAFNLHTLVFSLPPITLALALVVWLRHAVAPGRNALSFVALAATGMIAVFPIVNVFAGVVTSVRYNIVLYPLVSLVAGIGLWELVERRIRTPRARLAFSLLFIGTLSVSTELARPFYFTYTNDLLPKNRIISDAWGQGGYEAAQYINAQPNAESLVVWADYYGVCEFIRGICITDNHYSGPYRPDYYVLTRRGKIRYQPEHVRWRSVTAIEPYKYYPLADPIWHLHIDQRPQSFIRVYRADKP
jgi:hypothetical protein